MGLSKRSCTAILLLFLFLAAPRFSTGATDEESNRSDSPIYDIDYRGPETHTNIPPPKRGGRRNIIHHQQSMVAHHKFSKAARASTHGHNGKKYHK